MPASPRVRGVRGMTLAKSGYIHSSTAERSVASVPKSVIAYVTQWCPDCSRSRWLLQRLGVTFQEIDIEKVDGAEADMRARNGGSGKVPTILVDGRVLIEPSD